MIVFFAWVALDFLCVNKRSSTKALKPKMKLCHLTDVCLTMLLLLFSLFIQYNSVHGIQLKGHDATHHQNLIHIIIVLVNILFRYMEKIFCFSEFDFCFQSVFSLQRQENLSNQFYYYTQSKLRCGFSQ